MNSKKPGIAPVVVGLMVIAAVALAGCRSLSSHLPWAHHATPPPEVSTALTVAAPDGTRLAWPQVWQRNAVVLDLAGLSGAGSAVVMPRAGLAWPVRLALRVTPGSIGAIDLRGAQRVVLTVPAAGAGTVDLELPPGIYVAATKRMTLNWGPASVPAE